MYAGSTPTTLKLKSSSGFFSKAEYYLNFSLPGYDEKTVTVSSSIEGWYWGNILLGGLLGMLIIDPNRKPNTFLFRTLVFHKKEGVSKVRHTLFYVECRSINYSARSKAITALFNSFALNGCTISP